MSFCNNSLDDFFEIVTPDGVQLRLNTLRDAWLSLVKSNPTDKLIESEYKSFLSWYAGISDSYFSKLFATGTLNDLDLWQKRYENAFYSASNTSISPKPGTVKNEKPEIPLPNLNLVLGVLGVGAVAYLVFQVGKVKSFTSILSK